MALPDKKGKKRKEKATVLKPVHVYVEHTTIIRKHRPKSSANEFSLQKHGTLNIWPSQFEDSGNVSAQGQVAAAINCQTASTLTGMSMSDLCGNAARTNSMASTFIHCMYPRFWRKYHGHSTCQSAQSTRDFAVHITMTCFSSKSCKR